MLQLLIKIIIYYKSKTSNQMGCIPIQVFDSRQQIRVATLNYSGILLSPYEFYQKQDSQQKNLSERMKKFISTSQFQFQFLIFQRQWQKDRYSPLYNPVCGIKNNVNMMCQQQFLEQWERYKKQNIKFLTSIYTNQVQKKTKSGKDQKQLQKMGQQSMVMKPQKESKKDIKQQSLQPQQYYLQNLKKFDLLVYKSLLYQIYNEQKQQNELTSNFKNIDKFQLSAKKYRQHRKQMFKKSFLNQDLKIQQTIKALSNLKLDILFLQQASKQLLKAIEKKLIQYRIVKTCKNNSRELDSKSAIIIRQQRFPLVQSLLEQNSRLTNNIKELKFPGTKPQNLSQQKIRQLNINEDTVVQIIYNLILICPHLTSKSKKNDMQKKLLMNQLIFLKQNFPDCHIILGGDLNNKTMETFTQVINNQSVAFTVVPDCNKYFTVNKKRTQIQAQRNKADNANKEVKDYIITDLEIRSAKIMTVDGEVIDKCEINGVMGDDGEGGDGVVFRETRFKQPRLGDLPLLPSDKHPYDHYLVYARLALPKSEKMQHITDTNYLYKYKPHELKPQQVEDIYQQQRRKDGLSKT